LTDSALRRELVTEELKLTDGKLPLTEKPGLSIELDMKALERYRVED